MTLTDRETLELNELCNALVDETLADSQRERLERRLADSDNARRFYVQAMDLSGSLCLYAGEMQMEAADAPARVATPGSSLKWMWAAVAASLAIAGGFWAAGRNQPQAVEMVATAAGQPVEYVARLTGEKNCRWSDAAVNRTTGDFFRRGQQLDISQGYAEITFDSGAVVLLEGPAVFDVESAWNATLRRGTITAKVPPQAVGFRVSNPAVEVVDMGTEFSMVADGQNEAEVFVLTGAVEAVPAGEEGQESLLLRANESRRFALTGRVSSARDHEQMFARFRALVTLDSPSEPVRYVNWSFDALEGDVLPARVIGFAPKGHDFKLLRHTRAAIASALVAGFRGRALRFDGKQVAKAEFPGLSGGFTRTIAFWVNVPELAPLASSYSMVAWRADSDKLGSRPVHIGWNRNPDEGPIGALRTDFSGGYAMGTMSLRDGRWHHLSVIFVPGDDPKAPVHVKQYVDGRLESNTVTPGPKRSIAGNFKPDESLADGDILWLGCRLGASGPKRERFVGSIDELVIADQSLEPGEVVRLMDGQDLAAGEAPLSSSVAVRSR